MATQTSVQDFTKEIDNIWRGLVAEGLVDSTFPHMVSDRGSDGTTRLSGKRTLGDTKSGINAHVSYESVYQECLESNSYDFKFVDGALVQLSYEFKGKRRLIRSIQRYLPCPDLIPYIEDQSIYIHDVQFAEIATERTVTVPLRFDFDSRSTVVRAGHPCSHLTLGEYPNCRIPTTHPLTPSQFFEFLTEAFYTPNVSTSAGRNRWAREVTPLSKVISTLESKRVHVAVGPQN